MFLNWCQTTIDREKIAIIGLGCPHLVAVNVDSSHDAYVECDIDNEDILEL